MAVNVKFYRPRIGKDKRKRTYYFNVSSMAESIAHKDYTVSYAARRKDPEFKGHGWMCTCPDFTFTQEPKGGKCKHIRLVENLVHHVGGLKKIPFDNEISAVA